MRLAQTSETPCCPPSGITPVFKDHASCLPWPDQTVTHLLHSSIFGEDVGDHSSGEEEGKDNEDDDADSDDDDAFTAQEYSIDLNALARGGGKHNIIFMGNQMQQPISLSREQISQLRTAPNGDFMMPGRAPRGASRVKMLPPRAKKGVRAIVTTDDVPEPNCACGLSRYGVSARPILTMTTKTAEVEHRCMGSLFEGVDALHDVTDAIKVRRFDVKAGG